VCCFWPGAQFRYGSCNRYTSVILRPMSPMRIKVFEVEVPRIPLPRIPILSEKGTLKVVKAIYREDNSGNG